MSRKPILSKKFKKAMDCVSDRHVDIHSQLIDLENRLQTFSTQNGDRLEKLKINGPRIYSLSLNIKSRVVVAHSVKLNRFLFLQFLPKHQYNDLLSGRDLSSMIEHLESESLESTVIQHAPSPLPDKANPVKELSTFSGKLIALSATQCEIIDSIYPYLARNQRIVSLLFATAGSGKTLLVVQIINQLLDNAEALRLAAPIYYVSPKEALRHSVTSELRSKGHDTGVACIGYSELVKNTGETDTVPELDAFRQVLEAESVARQLQLKTKAKGGQLSAVVSTSPDTLLLSCEYSIEEKLSEFQIIAAILHACNQDIAHAKHVYLELPNKYALVSREDRENFFHWFNRIRFDLIERGIHDPGIMNSFSSQSAEPEPTAVFVDEAQSLSPLQLILIYLRFQRVMLVGDPYQQDHGLNDRLGLVMHLIRTHHSLTEKSRTIDSVVPEKNLTLFQLYGSYRLPSLIASVAQATISLMQKIKVDRQEQVIFSNRPALSSTVTVDLFNQAVNLTQSDKYLLSVAFVCSNPQQKGVLHGYPRVFSPSEIGGLEYQVVVVFLDDIFSRQTLRTLHTALSANKSVLKALSESEKTAIIDPLQDFFVACTRTTKHLVISLQDPHNRHAVQAFLNEWFMRSPELKIQTANFDLNASYFQREQLTLDCAAPKKNDPTQMRPHAGSRREQINPRANPKTHSFFSLLESINYEIAQERLFSERSQHQTQHKCSVLKLCELLVEVIEHPCCPDQIAAVLDIYKRLPSAIQLMVEKSHLAKLVYYAGESGIEILRYFASDPQVVELLIQSGANCHYVDQFGNTALMVAVNAGHIELVRTLLKAGVDINKANRDGRTPLMAAIFHGKDKIAQLLLGDERANSLKATRHGVTALHLAVQKGRSAIVQQLVDKEKDAINREKKDGSTPIFAAVCKGNREIAQLLLQSGALVNHRDKKGETPLFSAIRHKHMDMLRLLKNFGAEVGIHNRKGVSPCTMVMQIKSQEMFKILYPDTRELVKSIYPDSDYSANEERVKFLEKLNSTKINTPDEVTLFETASMGHLSKAKLDRLMRRNVDINCNHCLTGLTPLYHAVESHRTDVVRLLLKVKTLDVNKPCDGAPPLMIAIEQGDIGIIQLIVQDKRFDPNATASDGTNAFYYAVVNWRYEAMQLLYDAGVDINNSSNSCGLTPLYYAVKNGTVEMVRWLIKQDKIDIDKAPKGGSPLCLAVKNGQDHIAQLLLEAGADDTVTDANGNTLLDLASSNQSQVLVKLLQTLRFKRMYMSRLISWIETGKLDDKKLQFIMCQKGDINQRIKSAKPDLDFPILAAANGLTPLCLAVSHGHREIIEILIKAGANINHRTNTGVTPLHIAAIDKHADIARTLLEAKAEHSIIDGDERTALAIALESNDEQLKKVFTDHACMKDNDSLSKGVSP